jgi:hypothetical protein
MNKSMYLGLFHRTKFYSRNTFLFCPPLKYLSSPVPILLSEQIVRKYYFIIFSHPPLKIFKNSSALLGIKNVSPENHSSVDGPHQFFIHGSIWTLKFIGVAVNNPCLTQESYLV